MLNAGIVGLPNVGKSTIFSAITSLNVDAQNYPFCTIEPNKGLVSVPDKRLSMIAKYIKTQKIIPAVCEFVDIAGLVKGASKGEGLGNKFLSNIRETDLIIHVVRCFDNKDIIHVENSIDPKRDINIINTELLISDIEYAKKRFDKFNKDIKNQNKEISNIAREMVEVLKKIEENLLQDISIRNIEFNEREKDLILKEQFLTSKPIIYVLNVDEDFILEENEHTKSAIERIQGEDAFYIKISGQLEKEISLLENEQDKMDFLSSLGLEESGLDNLIKSSYSALGLNTYFTAGEKEIKAWTFKKGMFAPECASIIHTDFFKGFVKADVYSCELLDEYHSAEAIKNAGKMRLEGKEYAVKDGDVILFKLNL